MILVDTIIIFPFFELHCNNVNKPNGLHRNKMAHIKILKLSMASLIVVCGICSYLYLSLVDQSSDYGVATDFNPLLEQMVYLDRQEHLNKMCRMYLKNNSSKHTIDGLTSDVELLEHILVDLNHKLLYCYVPKVACTNWKRVFMILTGLANTSDALSIPAHVAHKRGIFLTLNNFTVPEIKYMLSTYKKFLFVRHPFERLLSAYRNKFDQNHVRSSYFQSRFGRYIIKNYRTNASKISLEKGDDVTFVEFAAYLTGPENVTFNEHWKPISDLCRPCLLKYDFIGKYETLHTDSEYLLKLSGLLSSTFPHLTKPSTTSAQLRTYFSMLPQNVITQLYNIYHMDFKIFNYDLEGMSTTLESVIYAVVPGVIFVFAFLEKDFPHFVTISTWAFNLIILFLRWRINPIIFYK